MLVKLTFIRNTAKRFGTRTNGTIEVMGFDTFQEAYTYYVGYIHVEMHDFAVIRKAVYDYQDGCYQFPLLYRIIPEIPPLNAAWTPAQPEDTIPWIISASWFSEENLKARHTRQSMFNTPSQPMTRTPTNACPDVEINTPLSNLNLSDPPSLSLSCTRRRARIINLAKVTTPFSPTESKSSTNEQLESVQVHTSVSAPSVSSLAFFPVQSPVRNNHEADGGVP